MKPMEELIAHLSAAGATLVGFADVTAAEESSRHGLPQAVVVGVALTPQIIAGIRQGPTEEYLGEYHRVNALLDEIAAAGAAWLSERGFPALALEASRITDREHLTAPFQHKTAARLAGFGWIGKCALLINREYGSAVRWNTILTEAPLPVGDGPTVGSCGECVECARVCPGQAPSGKAWETGMAREDFWDPRACVQGLMRIAQEREVSAPVCGMCIANCPHTLGYLHRAGAL